MLVLFAMVVLTADAYALCGIWAPNVAVSQSAGRESIALDINWSGSAPGACTNGAGDNWDGTNKLMLRRAAGTTAPSTPTSGVLVANLAPTTTAKTDIVHRSDKDYAYKLFACEDSTCSSWYADGSGTSESASGTSSWYFTAQEEWVLTGVTGEADVTSVAIDDPDANAPHAFFYPSTWQTGYSNRLALYYSKKAVGGAASEVFYTIHDDTAWPSANPINNPSSWASGTLVAQGSTDSADDDYNADHPWVMLTRDGTNKRVQLFVQSQDLSNNKVIQIESADAVGNDFGLSCGSSSCTTTILDGGGYLAIDADGTSGTSYVEHARHSRVAWNYIADPYVDVGTDTPFMMFQMERPNSGSCSDAGHDDIGRADGSWNGTTGTWEWDVETDGLTPDCPVVHVPNGHDNSMIPLTAGQFKMYYKDWSTEEWYVTYWNGTTWEDDTTIVFLWDGSSSGPSHECVENISAFVHVDVAVAREGMFFKLLDSDDTVLCHMGGGLDDDGTGTLDDAAIVFAQHAN